MTLKFTYSLYVTPSDSTKRVYACMHELFLLFALSVSQRIRGAFEEEKNHSTKEREVSLNQSSSPSWSCIGYEAPLKAHVVQS